MSDVQLVRSDRKMAQLFLDIQSKQSANTARTYRSVIDGFVSHINKPFAHVTLEDVVDYANSISHLAPTTQHRMLSTMKSFYSFLSTQPGYLLANPWAAFKPVKLEKSQDVEHVLSKEEVNRIRDAIRYRNKRDWLIVTTLYATGCRITELLNARWCDVLTDFDGNIGLRVLGKGKKVRVVKLNKSLFNQIVNYRIENGLNADVGSGDITPIFVNRNGTTLTSRYIEKVVSDAAQRANIGKSVTPHWMRHSHATTALWNGADVYTVKESLGHEDIKVTMRYLHTINRLKQTAADFIDLDV